jgi:hypothetical protein
VDRKLSVTDLSSIHSEIRMMSSQATAHAFAVQMHRNLP